MTTLEAMGLAFAAGFVGAILGGVVMSSLLAARSTDKAWPVWFRR